MSPGLHSHRFSSSFPHQHRAALGKLRTAQGRGEDVGTQAAMSLVGSVAQNEGCSHPGVPLTWGGSQVLLARSREAHKSNIKGLRHSWSKQPPYFPGGAG